MRHLAYLVPFLLFFSPARSYAHWSDYTVTAAVVAPIAFMPTWEKRGVALGAQVVSMGVNTVLKKIINEPRPDDPNDQGMPSGHSQAAMLGAGQLCLEHKTPACVGGLALAGATMAGRVMANRHTPAQVVVGGGLGFFLGRYLMSVVAVQW